MKMSDDAEKNTRMDAQRPDEDRPIDPDWENRRLCSDGNCIGVIGPDGRCKECGKVYEGDLPESFPAPQPSPDAPPAEEDTEKPSAEDLRQHFADTTSDEAAADSEDSSWKDRILCSDGNCIGVIGPDGRCKECGRPYTPEEDAP